MSFFKETKLTLIFSEGIFYITFAEKIKFNKPTPNFREGIFSMQLSFYINYATRSFRSTTMYMYMCICVCVCNWHTA